MRASSFLLNFSGCRRFDPVSLGTRGFFGFVNYGLGALVGGLNDACSLSLSIGQLFICLLLCHLEVVTGAICCGETVRDLVLSFRHGASNRGPNVTHTKGDKRHKGDQLSYQGEINVHSLLLWC
jgi:hypothetical protein